MVLYSDQMPAPAETTQPLDKILPLHEAPNDLVSHVLRTPIPEPSHNSSVEISIPTIPVLERTFIKADGLIPPSDSDKAQANSSRRSLRNIVGSPWFKAAEFGTLGTAALACAAPIAGGQPNSQERAAGGETENIDQIVAQRALNTENHYLHHSVEVEDESARDQCMDYMFAYLGQLGIDRSVLRAPSAADLINLANNPKFKEYFKLGNAKAVPPAGSIVVLLPNHVAVATGDGSVENGVVTFNATSQNWATPDGGKPTVEEDTFHNPAAVFVPIKVGDPGAWTAFDDVPGAIIRSPEPSGTRSSNRPEASSEVSELSEQEQAFYYAAKNLFEFFSKKTPYSVPINNDYGEHIFDYNVENNGLVFPEGVTEEEVLLMLARGETVNLDQPIIATSTVSYVNKSEDWARIDNYQIALNDLRMDAWSFSGHIWDEPVSDAEKRNGIEFHGYSHIYGSIAFGGVHGEVEASAGDAIVKDLFDRVKETSPLDPGQYQDFDFAIYTLLTANGNSFNPDFANGISGSGTGMSGIAYEQDPSNSFRLTPNFLDSIGITDVGSNFIYVRPKKS